MDPGHDSLAPSRARDAQSFAADFALLICDLIQLPLLLFLAALDVLVLAWRPLLLSALLQELGAVLLERRDGEENELFVLGDLC